MCLEFGGQCESDASGKNLNSFSPSMRDHGRASSRRKRLNQILIKEDDNAVSSVPETGSRGEFQCSERKVLRTQFRTL